MTTKTAQELCNELVRIDRALTNITIDLDTEDSDGDDWKIQMFEVLKRNAVTLKRLTINNGSLSMNATLSLAAAVLHISSLENLKLNDVDLGSSFGMLTLAIERNKNLKSLSLFCSGTNWTNYMNDGVRCLIASNSLEELLIEVVESSVFVNHEAVHLADVITRNESLKMLRIHDSDNVSSETIRGIAQFLRTNQSLQSLSIMNRTLDGGEVELIALAATGHESLERLVLESDHIGGLLTDCDVRAISTMLRNSPTLKEFELIRYDLEDEEACRLFSSLNGKKCNLEKLDLRDNLIREDGLSHLAGVLSGNSKLKHLGISRNLVSDACVPSLIKILNQNSTLEKLIMDDTLLGPAGIESIAQSLTENVSLKELRVDLNLIGNRGANALARMLTVNTTLEAVSVGSFPEAGLEEWTRHLPGMKGLKSLHVYSIRKLTEEAAQGFAEALERNMVIETVFTSCIDSEPRVEEIMKRAELLVALNRAGRRILKSSSVPSALWPRILAKSSHDPDVLYYFLREKNSDLIGRKKVAGASSRKRKRGEWLRSFLW